MAPEDSASDIAGISLGSLVAEMLSVWSFPKFLSIF
jgi:hypothetical protein